MKHSDLPAPLHRFVGEVNALLVSGEEESSLHRKVRDAMRVLVAEDDWLDPAFAEPHPHHYQQYLLYADPDDRFSVVSFVWGPGQHTPIHDHTVWGVIGMLRGAERTQNYELFAESAPNPVGDEMRLMPGAVAMVSPAIGDVHRVRNALSDQVSISIHAYGGNIGKILRHVFPAEGGAPREFVSGYSNASDD
jgi:predicted metal-dependent enzyme (double-stranded beta helix superfamily)